MYIFIIYINIIYIYIYINIYVHAYVHMGAYTHGMHARRIRALWQDD